MRLFQDTSKYVPIYKEILPKAFFCSKRMFVRHSRVRSPANTKKAGYTPALDLWSGREDSNLRPPAPHAGTLTRLRYVPFRPWYSTLKLACGQCSDVKKKFSMLRTEVANPIESFCERNAKKKRRRESPPFFRCVTLPLLLAVCPSRRAVYKSRSVLWRPGQPFRKAGQQHPGIPFSEKRSALRSLGIL